jgi:hypothetical protein
MVSANECIDSENKAHDQDIRNHTNFMIVIIQLPIRANNTDKNQCDL